MSAAVLAVDGGQSTIRVRHSGGAEGEAPGVSWGAHDTVAATATRVVDAWRTAGSPAVQTVVLGLTTVPDGAGESDRLASLIAEALGADRVLVCDDGITAHAGALDGSWGIVLAVGTGVACIARSQDGRTAFIGGRGYLLGDEGGAFWIGRAGIAAAMRATEGRGIHTRLTTPATDAFGDLAAAHIRIHADPRAVDRIARFAPIVIDAARAGDAAAREIVDEATAELIACVRAGIAAADAERPTPLAVVGRLAEALRTELDDALAGLGDLIDRRQAAGDAMAGALRLAENPSDYGTAVHRWTRG
jgi:N-acetylglucosamine kinase-like BadF-type ATPase